MRIVLSLCAALLFLVAGDARAAHDGELRAFQDRMLIGTEQSVKEQSEAKPDENVVQHEESAPPTSTPPVHTVSNPGTPCGVQCQGKGKLCFDSGFPVPIKGCNSCVVDRGSVIYRWTNDDNCVKSYSPCLSECQAKMLEDVNSPLEIDGVKYGIGRDTLRDILTELAFLAGGDTYSSQNDSGEPEYPIVDMASRKQFFSDAGWLEYQKYVGDSKLHLPHIWVWRLFLPKTEEVTSGENGALKFSDECIAYQDNGDVGTPGSRCRLTVELAKGIEPHHIAITSWQFSFDSVKPSRASTERADAKKSIDPPYPVSDELANLQKKATSGDIVAQYLTGVVFLSGLGVKADGQKALDWLHKAADQGYAPAQAELGHAYESGWAGIKVDNAEAMEWYRKAADQGSARGQVGVGALYTNGWGDRKTSWKVTSGTC